MVFDICRGLCYCLYMEKINIALIGCGFLGQRHLKTLHALRHKANITAICDLHLEHAKVLGRQYHLPVVGDYRELPDDITPSAYARRLSRMPKSPPSSLKKAYMHLWKNLLPIA